MKTQVGFLTPAYRAALAAACLLVLAGCRGEHSPGDEHERTTSATSSRRTSRRRSREAVHRLRELNDQFVREAAQGSRGGARREDPAHRAGHRQLAPRDRRRQRHARDALERGERPVRGARRGLPGDRLGRRRRRARRGADAGEEIAELETLLASADPGGSPGRRGRGGSLINVEGYQVTINRQRARG